MLKQKSFLGAFVISALVLSLGVSIVRAERVETGEQSSASAITKTGEQLYADGIKSATKVKTGCMTDAKKVYDSNAGVKGADSAYREKSGLADRAQRVYNNATPSAKPAALAALNTAQENLRVAKAVLGEKIQVAKSDFETAKQTCTSAFNTEKARFDGPFKIYQGEVKAAQGTQTAALKALTEKFNSDRKLISNAFSAAKVAASRKFSDSLKK